MAFAVLYVMHVMCSSDGSNSCLIDTVLPQSCAGSESATIHQKGVIRTKALQSWGIAA
jgi:hypothetical protein